MLSTGQARADEVDECIAAHPEAQRLRNAGLLRAAREQLLRCSRDSCPAAVRVECGNMVEEVELKLPTIVLDARDNQGHDLVGVWLSVDDGPRQEFRGTAIALDPGAHSLRFEHRGSRTTMTTVMIREGEKNRVIRVALEPLPTPKNAVLSTGNARPIPTSSVLFGTLGALGVVGFSVLGLSAKADVEHLRETCNRACTDDEVGSLRTKLIFANVSLGVGLLSLGVATALYLTRPARTPSIAALHTPIP